MNGLQSLDDAVRSTFQKKQSVAANHRRERWSSKPTAFDAVADIRSRYYEKRYAANSRI